MTRRCLVAVALRLAVAGAALCAGGARAQEVDTEVHVGPPELQAPLFGESAVDDGFPAFVDDVIDLVGRRLDAAVADEVLASIGRMSMGSAGRLAVLTHKAAPGNPFRARAPHAIPGDAPDLTFDQLTNHSFGSNRLLAVGVSQKLRNNLTNLSTDVNLRHTTGPLDVQVNVSGNQGLNMAQPMSVTYDSAALFDVNPHLEVGMVARGGLGTLGALAPSMDQVAGPIARIKLFGNGTSMSAETGYTFRMRQESDPSLNRFHAKLNLNVKL